MDSLLTSHGAQVGKVAVHALQQTNLQLEMSLLSRFADMVEQYSEFFARGAKILGKLMDQVEPARRTVEAMRKQVADMTTSGVDRVGQLHLLQQLQQEKVLCSHHALHAVDSPSTRSMFYASSSSNPRGLRDPASFPYFFFLFCLTAAHAQLQEPAKKKKGAQSETPAAVLKSMSGDLKYPLHQSCSLGHLENVKFFLELYGDDDVDAPDAEGRTPLHVAAQQGHLPVCLLLLQHRASPFVLAPDGSSALHHFCALRPPQPSSNASPRPPSPSYSATPPSAPTPLSSSAVPPTDDLDSQSFSKVCAVLLRRSHRPVLTSLVVRSSWTR